MVYIRGGSWTNVEDEIVKAAVAKYGLNQWSRVASLLSRKTAKQVKARWHEWLDPAIDKSEWNEEYDQKLLFLARTMPNMWQSIGPMLKRTAAQAAERYQYLLLNGTKLGDDSDKPQEDETMALPVGDHTESRPAIPDAVDMEDDELEMLAEARARLANTKGRKAKRKERERFLEQKARVELIQKRRELKEAGVSKLPAIREKQSKYSVDYNAEIPFQLAVPEGIHDVTEENEQDKLKRDQFAAELQDSGKTFGKAPRTRKGDKPTQEDDDIEGIAVDALKEHRAKRRKLVFTSDETNEPGLIEAPEMKLLTASDEPKRQNDLASKFASLPKPSREIDLVMPSPPAQMLSPPEQALDAEVVDAMESEELNSRQASAIRLGLPIITKVTLKPNADIIDREVAAMLSRQSDLLLPSLDLVATANALIDEELDESNSLESPTGQIPVAIDHGKKLEKLRKKVGLLLGGYNARYRSLQESMQLSLQAHDEIDTEQRSYLALAGWEDESVQIRLSKLQNLVDMSSTAERETQDLYRQLG